MMLVTNLNPHKVTLPPKWATNSLIFTVQSSFNMQNMSKLENTRVPPVKTYRKKKNFFWVLTDNFDSEVTFSNSYWFFDFNIKKQLSWKNLLFATASHREGLLKDSCVVKLSRPLNSHGNDSLAVMKVTLILDWKRLGKTWILFTQVIQCIILNPQVLLLMSRLFICTTNICAKLDTGLTYKCSKANNHFWLLSRGVSAVLEMGIF